MIPSKTTVVIPTLNEAEGIEPTIQDLIKELVNPEIIVIDGHSTDGTPKIAAELGAKVLTQSGIGKGPAIAEAIQQVSSDTLWLVIIDGDHTYPAKYIPQMIRLISENSSLAMISGNTKSRPKSLQAHCKKLLTDRFYLADRIFIILHRIFNGVNMRDPFSGLRLLRFSCIRGFTPKAHGFDIEVEINHFIVKVRGMRIVEIPIFLRKRLGKVKYGYANALEIVRRIAIMALEDIVGHV